jgi:hypothetical protein
LPDFIGGKRLRLPIYAVMKMSKMESVEIGQSPENMKGLVEKRLKYRLKIHYLDPRPISEFLLPALIRKSLIPYYVSLYMGNNVKSLEFIPQRHGVRCKYGKR